MDESQQSMTFAGDIEQGSTAQLMRANLDHIVEAAENAASTLNCSDQNPGVVVSISCVGRRLILRERTEDETEAVLEKLPQNVSQVGFYSYGEISPRAKGRPCELHNQTMTLTLIKEK